jgi:hypothetical protein
MAAPLRPTSTKMYLKERWIFVPTGSYDPDAPSLAILEGSTALDVTNMFFQSSARPSQSTNLARSPKRVGDAESYEFVGETQPSLGELRYAFNPQAAAASDGKKASEKLLPGATGHLVNRLGIDRDTDSEIGDFVTSYPVELGPQLEVPEGADEGAEVAIAQIAAQTGPKSMNVALVA